METIFGGVSSTRFLFFGGGIVSCSNNCNCLTSDSLASKRDVIVWTTDWKCLMLTAEFGIKLWISSSG